MLEALLFYFVPMWYVGLYYLIRNRKLLNWISVVLVVAVVGFLGTYARGVLGIGNCLIWGWLFGAGITLLWQKKKFLFHYAVFLSFILTVFMTEVWEIPIHIWTVTVINPTWQQLLKTFMLSSPYLALGIPLFYEFRKYAMHWLFLLVLFVGTTILMQPFNPYFYPENKFLFQTSGYPINDVNYVYRIIWAIVSLVLLWRIRKVEDSNDN